VKTRILAPEEWPRALERSGQPSWPYIDPSSVDIVAVEDDAGALIACMTVLKVTHFEGVWIDPEYRGKSGVMRALLRASGDIPRARGENWVFGGAADGDDVMRRYLGKLGGVEMPLSFWALWVGGKQCRQQ
jgi:hypothetical protein